MATPAIALVATFTPAVATEVAPIEATALAPIEATSESAVAEVATALPPTVTLWQDALSQRIVGLWCGYRRDRKALGSALEEQKRALEGQKYGQWVPFLEYADIPRSSADRLIAGYLKYVALQTGFKMAAEAEGIDLCKPSVQRALALSEVGFDEVTLSTAEVLKTLKAAVKPRRNSSPLPPLKGIERVKRDIREFLDKVDAAQRDELAYALCDWLEDEFALVVSKGESDPVE